MIKYSVRIFLNKKIRAIWDDENSKWWYSAVDVLLVLTDSNNPRIYWSAVKRRNPVLNAFCRQLRLYAEDGKKYLSDVIDERGVDKLGFILPSKKNEAFQKWMETIRSTVGNVFEIVVYREIKLLTLDSFCADYSFFSCVFRVGRV